MDGTQVETAPREAVIGDNKPPSDIEILLDKLAEKHRPILDRAAELVGALVRVPDSIDDDEVCGKAADFVKQLTAAEKNAEGARVAEKEPYLAGGRVVDGFFDRVKKSLADTKTAVQERVTVYLKRKEAAERRRREEEARRAREEAARIEAERRRKEDEERRAREAEAQRVRDEAARLRAEALAAAADPVLAPMAEAALAEASQLEATAIAASDPAGAPLDRAALGDSMAADQVAHEKTQAAEEKPADLARTRSTYGSVATLRRGWVFEFTDYDAIDLEKLRPYLAKGDIEKALKAFIRAGHREIKGARIFETSTSAIS